MVVRGGVIGVTVNAQLLSTNRNRNSDETEPSPSMRSGQKVTNGITTDSGKSREFERGGGATAGCFRLACPLCFPVPNCKSKIYSFLSFLSVLPKSKSYPQSNPSEAVRERAEA